MEAPRGAACITRPPPGSDTPISATVRAMHRRKDMAARDTLPRLHYVTTQIATVTRAAIFPDLICRDPNP
jgi:hypothetical protein